MCDIVATKCSGGLRSSRLSALTRQPSSTFVPQLGAEQVSLYNRGLLLVYF